MSFKLELEILTVLIMAFSLAALPGISAANGDVTSPSGTTPLTQWSIGGPASDAIRFQYYGGPVGDTNEYNALCFGQPGSCVPQVDLSDVQIPTSLNTPANLADSRFYVTPETPGGDMVALSFNLANSFFGVEFCNGADGITNSSTCPDGPGATSIPAACPGTIYHTPTGLLDCTRAGIAIRQGIAHLIDKQGYVTNVLQGQGFALDNPITPAQSLPHSGYPDPCLGLPPVPCSPDTLFNSQGMGSYAIDPTLPVGDQIVPLGSEPACTTPLQQQGNGGRCEINVGGACSWDLLGTCGIGAFHLQGDGPSTANGIVQPGTPDFCAAAQLFVNAGLGTGVSTPATGCQIQNFCVNHGGGTECFTTGTAGTPGGPILLIRRTSFDRGPLTTGLATAICQLINGPSATTCLQAVNTPTLGLAGGFTVPTPGCLSASEPGTNCTVQGPIRTWNMYPTGQQLPSTPNQLWSLYNSQFASDLCGGTPNQYGGNFGYDCNSNFDIWGSETEFDSTPRAAIADMQVALDIFGNHTFTIPVLNHGFQQAYLKGWTGVSNAASFSGPGNYWSLLNMWSPNPTLPGPTIRWGQHDNTTYLNPFLIGTGLDYSPVELNLISEIYDPLLQTNPYNPSQLFGWMANSYSMVTNAQDSNCPASVTRNMISFPVAGCIKLLLRGDISWHDVMNCRNTDTVCLETHSVTASDVKFSIAAFNATNSIFQSSTANIADVVYSPNVLPSSAYGGYGGSESAGQPELFYIALKSLSAWAPFDIASIPIVPQHLWSTASSAGPCLSLDTPQCAVDPNYLTGSGSDPVITNKLIGSGPFVCASGPLGASGTIIGGGCIFDASGSPTGQSITTGGSAFLRRFGAGLSLNYAYFRTNGKFKNFAWADYLSSGSGPNNGFGSRGTVSISDVQSVASCLGKSAPAGTCTAAAFAHWSAPAASTTCNSAIGPCIGTVNGGASTVSIGTISQVARWYLTQWADTTTPMSPMPLLYGVNGNQLPGTLPAPGSGNQILFEDGTNETS